MYTFLVKSSTSEWVPLSSVRLKKLFRSHDDGDEEDKDESLIIIISYKYMAKVQKANNRKLKIFNPNPTRKKFLIPKTRPEPEKNFNNQNQTRTRKKFLITITRAEPEKNFFQTQTQLKPEKKIFYVTILALKIFKTASNIRISIGYKDNICQRWFLSPNPTRTRKLKPENRPEPEKKMVFKPEPDPISGKKDIFKFF